MTRVQSPWGTALILTWGLDACAHVDERPITDWHYGWGDVPGFPKIPGPPGNVVVTRGPNDLGWIQQRPRFRMFRTVGDWLRHTTDRGPGRIPHRIATLDVFNPTEREQLLLACADRLAPNLAEEIGIFLPTAPRPAAPVDVGLLRATAAVFADARDQMQRCAAALDGAGDLLQRLARGSYPLLTPALIRDTAASVASWLAMCEPAQPGEST